MPSIPTSPVRSAFERNPALASIQLRDGSTAGEALAAQPIIAAARTDDGAFAGWRGANDAGRRLLDSETGAGLTRVLNTLHAELDAPARQALQGVRLTKSAADAALSWTITRFENEAGLGKPVPDPAALPLDRLRSWVGDDQKTMGSIYDASAERPVDTSWAGEWITFGPKTTAGLLKAAHGQRSVEATSAMQVGLHEFEHTRSPSTAQQWTKEWSDLSFEQRMAMPMMDQIRRIAPVNWMEEATASILSEWPGRMDAIMQKAGVPVAPAQLPDDYQHATAGLRRLLVLAGIDPTLPSHRQRADALLQQRNVADVPAAISDAIATAHRLPAGAASTLAPRIERAGSKIEIFTDPELITQRIDDIAKYVEQHSRNPSAATSAG